jgi:hypothetical protein
MDRSEIRLRLLELALHYGPSDPVGFKLDDAESFAEFVFDREPARLRIAGVGKMVSAKLAPATRGTAKAKKAKR